MDILWFYQPWKIFLRFKDDIPLKHSGKITIINGVSKYTLIIHDLKLEDSGEYKIVAGNYTSSAKLNVPGTKGNFL